LKGVRRLIVIPSGKMARFPVEALTDRYTISYAPPASVFALTAEKHRALQETRLLALADPAFETPPAKPPEPPPHGLLVKAVPPGSLAARLRLSVGDVLLEYNGQRLNRPADLKPSAGDASVSLKFWRAGQALAGRIPPGELGVLVDDRPLQEALGVWRDQEDKQ
jgi:S1-C subfamily serine protease